MSDLKSGETNRMPERRRCEFFLLRYVPDAVKDEFVNVGVVLIAQEGDAAFADVRFTRDWKRVRCLDPDVDIEILEGIEREIKDRLVEGGATREWLLHRMGDTFSNAIQVTTPKAVLTHSPQEEIGRLAELYLERNKRGIRLVSGRQQIFAVMRGEFERQGVWPLMRHNIPVAEYTHKGDPLKIDCGYTPNGIVHLYHAISLESDVSSAKVLAFTFPKLREGIAQAESAETQLTAIVESELNRDDDAVAFALATFSASGIMVANLSEMPRIAENVRSEMKL